METAERRHAIMRVLYRRGHETIANLASEFGVSDRTIRRDIEALSLTRPIYTQSGRYGGGVYIMEGYSLDRDYITDVESQIFQKLYRIAEKQEQCVLTEKELNIFRNFVINYTNPINEKGL